MARYNRRHTEPVEAITFDEFVKHGILSGAPLIGDMPGDFNYERVRVLYENEHCYLIPAYLIAVNKEYQRFNQGDMLVTILPKKLAVFAMENFNEYFEEFGNGNESQAKE